MDFGPEILVDKHCFAYCAERCNCQRGHQRPKFLGMEIILNPTMPPGEVSFRIAGKEVGRIVNASPKEPHT